MTQRVHELPAILTCFAYREEYFNEMDGMLATIREHHPSWHIVAGKGPIQGFDLPTLKVESPKGELYWSLPVSLNLEGVENDWHKICAMKAWWIKQVWDVFGHMTSGCKRIVWSDADCRFNGPLDIELDPDAEVLAGPWWYDADNPANEHLCLGLLVLQGYSQGPVETLLGRWSSRSIEAIQNGRVLTDGDQETFIEAFQDHTESNGADVLLKLDMEKYIGFPTNGDERAAKALIDHWYMSAKMLVPEHRDRNWPPPEDYRRDAEVGTQVPNINWGPDD